MKRLLLLPLLLLFGCAQNHFNVPQETIAEKVRVLGVAPIMIDAGSEISHPEREALLALLEEQNRAQDPLLVRKLKATGNFFTVVLMDDPPQPLFSTLLFRREKRDDASVVYNKHFWNAQELEAYLQKNRIDALMLVAVSGITKKDKMYSRDLLDGLFSDYNYLVMSAQIVDKSGMVLWEYPNFRQRLLTYYPMVNLQYPDFSEAEANLMPLAQVKFKTIDGLKRAFARKQKDMLLRETHESGIYGRQFDEMISLLALDRDVLRKGNAPAETPAAAPVQDAVPAAVPPSAEADAPPAR